MKYLLFWGKKILISIVVNRESINTNVAEIKKTKIEFEVMGICSLNTIALKNQI